MLLLSHGNESRKKKALNGSFKTHSFYMQTIVALSKGQKKKRDYILACKGKTINIFFPVPGSHCSFFKASEFMHVDTSLISKSYLARFSASSPWHNQSRDSPLSCSENLPKIIMQQLLLRSTPEMIIQCSPLSYRFLLVLQHMAWHITMLIIRVLHFKDILILLFKTMFIGEPLSS